jgi:hypothetical protein
MVFNPLINDSETKGFLIHALIQLHQPSTFFNLQHFQTTDTVNYPRTHFLQVLPLIGAQYAVGSNSTHVLTWPTPYPLPYRKRKGVAALPRRYELR